MSPGQRRLAALIAAFAPGSAQRLVALLSTSASDGVAEHTASLARCPREERLAALTAAFSSPKVAGAAELVRGHPLWQRLAREALARDSRPPAASAPRTGVQHQDGHSCAHRELAAPEVDPAAGTLHEITRRR